MALSDHPRMHSAAQAAGTGAGMTAAHGEMTGERGGDGDGLPEPAQNAWVKAVSGTVAARQEADGARKNLKLPRKLLTNSQDEETLTIDGPGGSWECPIWEMSVKALLTPRKNRWTSIGIGLAAERHPR